MGAWVQGSPCQLDNDAVAEEEDAEEEDEGDATDGVVDYPTQLTLFFVILYLYLYLYL